MPKQRRPTRWALQDAKNRFSEVVDAAVNGEPQVVTRRGLEAVVIVGHEQYAHLVAARDKGPALGEYLAMGRGSLSGEPFERIVLRARDQV